MIAGIDDIIAVRAGEAGVFRVRACGLNTGIDETIAAASVVVDTGGIVINGDVDEGRTVTSTA